ncbi:MAG: hypothetical protein IKM31_03750 [Oscillospiraceae bacterium]|nr:hypothetical protein [Oscillospiraceae bacterium]
MYLLSHDKKTLIQFGRVNIDRYFGGLKGAKYALNAWGTAIANVVTVGLYPDEEAAKRELARIVAALKDGQSVYEVESCFTE